MDYRTYGHIPVLILLIPLLMGVSGFESPSDLGNEAYKKGEYEESLRHYRDAVEAEPDKAGPHYNLGNAFYKLGEYERALEQYQAARELDPDMPDAHYNAGDALFRMERYEDALKAFGKAQSLYGEDPDTGHNIEITEERIRKKEEEQQKQEQQQQQQKKKPDDDQNGGKDKEKKDGQGGKPDKGGQDGSQTGRQQGPPAMSNEELKALMERQAYEEKRLRNYFKPGKDKEKDGDSQIEQLLRGMGAGALERNARPGQPNVEKDW